MIRDYLEEKVTELSKKKDSYQIQLEKLQREEENIFEKLQNVEKEEAFDFELFSPRIGEISLKEKMVELKERRREIIYQKTEVKEKMVEIETEYKIMKEYLTEVIQLEELAYS